MMTFIMLTFKVRLVNLRGYLKIPKLGKAMVATIRSRVKWKQVGDKCVAEFFKSLKQKNAKVVICELKDH
jgi:hypothetical protein